MLFSMIISIVIAHFLTELFEKKFNSLIRTSKIYAFLTVALTLFLALFSTLIRQNPLYIAGQLDLKKLYWQQEFEGCIETTKNLEDRLARCFKPKRSEHENVIFSVGDSHAGQIALMLKEFGKKNDFEVLLLHSGDKPNSIHSFGHKGWKKKPAIFEELLRLGKKNDIAVFTFGSFHMDKVSPPEFKNALSIWRSYLREYTTKGMRLILILDSPYYPNFPIESCFFDNKFKTTSRCRITRDTYLKQRSEQEKFFKELQKSNPQIIIWDMIDEFCEKECSAITKENINYFDYNHITKDRVIRLERGFSMFFQGQQKE